MCLDSKNFSRGTVAKMALAVAGLIISATPALSHAGVLYSTDFEPGDLGTSDFYDSTSGNQGENIAITANGTGALGLTAPSGTHYAEITNTDDAYSISQGLAAGYGQSTFTDYGYFRNGGTFDPISGQPLGPGVATTGAFYESEQYYINTNWKAPSAALGPAFWIDTTPFSDPNSKDETNFRVTVPGDNTVQVGGFIGNPGTNGPVATITSSGWYTFKTTFENTGGFVSNDLSIINSLGVTIGSLDGLTTLPFADLSGTNYGDWTTVWQDGFGDTTGPNENGAADVLGIDDVQVGTVPEPTSLGLIALAGVAVLRRRRRSI
jgi:hypothetical protein